MEIDVPRGVPQLKRKFEDPGFTIPASVFATLPAAQRRSANLRFLSAARRFNARLRRRNVRGAGFLGIEHKFLDSSVAATTAMSAPTDASSGEIDPTTVNCINAVAQGDGEQNRDGRSYVIDSVMIRGTLFVEPLADQTVTLRPVTVFLALVLDTQTNAAQMNSEDCFKNIAGSARLASAPFRNLLQNNRFRILWSKRISMGQTIIGFDNTNMEKEGVERQFSIFKKKLKIKVVCKGTSANVTDIVDNSLHLIGYQSGTNAQTVTIGYNARIRFRG